MPRIRRVLPTAVLASLLVGKAWAEQPPQLLPTRDVDIIYDVTLHPNRVFANGCAISQ